MPKQRIKITKDGPYLVSGGVPLKKEIIVTDEDNQSVDYKPGQMYSEQENYSLCRCGKSKNKPFCDGSHLTAQFDGTETADRAPYDEQAMVINGPNLTLTDVQDLCAVGRFCHPHGGTWNLTENSDDPQAREYAIDEACKCPSGRLVARDKETGEAIEPDFEPSISLIVDPPKGVGGPIWAKGKISIESSDGTEYESRNRVTLCRCGESGNKPFCDGSHISCGFSDEA
jgi:CDGSH-type Zn-finger protein